MSQITRRAFTSALGFSLLVGPVRAQRADSTPQGFVGRIFLNERNGVRVHTYVSDPTGTMVTSHIIETANGLVVVDAQLTPLHAKELGRYISSIGKPIQRLIVSHEHPDHWLGIHHLGNAPVYAGPRTAAFLTQAGPGVVAAMKADSSGPKVAGTIAEGTQTIGGIEFRFRHVLDTEAPEIVVTEIPAAGIAIVQDLVYNKVHAYATRQIGEWIKVLRDLDKHGSRTPIILAGHGEPAMPTDLPGFVGYLEALKPIVESNIGKEAQAEALTSEMAKAFPAYRVPPLLTLGLSRALKA